MNPRVPWVPARLLYPLSLNKHLVPKIPLLQKADSELIHLDRANFDVMKDTTPEMGTISARDGCFTKADHLGQGLPSSGQVVMRAHPVNKWREKNHGIEREPWIQQNPWMINRGVSLLSKSRPGWACAFCRRPAKHKTKMCESTAPLGNSMLQVLGKWLLSTISDWRLFQRPRPTRHAYSVLFFVSTFEPSLQGLSRTHSLQEPSHLPLRNARCETTLQITSCSWFTCNIQTSAEPAKQRKTNIGQFDRNHFGRPSACTGHYRFDPLLTDCFFEPK